VRSSLSRYLVRLSLPSLPLPSLRHSLFFSLLRPPPTSTLFPYTTLFRSAPGVQARRAGAVRRAVEGAGHRAVLRLAGTDRGSTRSEEHTSELQSLTNLVCRLLLEKKKNENDRHDQRTKGADTLVDSTTPT